MSEWFRNENCKFNDCILGKKSSVNRCRHDRWKHYTTSFVKLSSSYFWLKEEVHSNLQLTRGELNNNNNNSPSYSNHSICFCSKSNIGACYVPYRKMSLQMEKPQMLLRQKCSAMTQMSYCTGTYHKIRAALEAESNRTPWGVLLWH